MMLNSGSTQEERENYQIMYPEFTWGEVQPNRIDPNVKAELVAALRSGEYEQAQGTLKAISFDGTEILGYCCLGVRCDLLVKKGFGHWEIESRDGFAGVIGKFCDDRPLTLDEPWVNDATIVLPESVQEKDGWFGSSGEFAFWAEHDSNGPKEYTELYTLTTLNDDGFSFSQIADVIEYFL